MGHARSEPNIFLQKQREINRIFPRSLLQIFSVNNTHIFPQCPCLYHIENTYHDRDIPFSSNMHDCMRNTSLSAEPRKLMHISNCISVVIHPFCWTPCWASPQSPGILQLRQADQFHSCLSLSWTRKLINTMLKQVSQGRTVPNGTGFKSHGEFSMWHLHVLSLGLRGFPPGSPASALHQNT